MQESQPQLLTFLTLSHPSDQKRSWVWGPQRSRPLRGAVVTTSRWAEPALMRSPPRFLRREQSIVGNSQFLHPQPPPAAVREVGRGPAESSRP